VIAEAGVNHNGSPHEAHELVDLAADCGADAIKFQTFDPAAVSAQSASAAPYQREHGASGQFSMLERLTLPDSVWPELTAHAGERGIIFLSTAFDTKSLELVVSLGVPALKVPSGELDNLPFIEELAACGLPLFLSTGLGTMSEIGEAMARAAEAPGVCILHCVTAYPTPTWAANLRAITTLREQFKVPVGWSDHTLGALTGLASVALGAAVLEKHITRNRHAGGPDHAASEDPDGFRSYVSAVREVEAALGTGEKVPAEVEELNREHVRRSWHARRDLKPGSRLDISDVHLVRPLGGLPPSEKLVGRTVVRPLTAGQPVKASDVQ
jgi:N-acetylneuraminate synthase/N,N'-diacetyllegionaminate synthase